MALEQYQREFIEFLISQEILSFGSFTLKSGRISPYFLNTGKFSTGESLSKIGKYYAKTIESYSHELAYDGIFGPAYKAIPLISSTVIALSDVFKKNIPYSFNRKEIKDHGEGGNIVGASLSGKILIIDDVITAGTSIRESFEIISKHGAKVSSVLIAVDRQEKGTGHKSAVQQIESDFGVPVKAIVNLDQIIEYIEEKGDYDEHLIKMKEYKALYGV
ncbi:orotate phosphoribosyl transferase [Rhizophagus irregularis]|uniref:orotate phosphoribosyltransferase n=3 Tax=Rhizophagus irregularis TaxID=588596 RepID=U9TU84_RHIID|nr:orotate phosphoribosyl transferase [Rhizophagus irregularis DAOM 181602=DAOM 197198]EXX69532.1 orotate phosphoribosyltransferase URA5 [Rhizophagus irregularis DAOM 197198w]PKC13818.1 orotate phosphoribosyl transferase [Rhizophagus irregularis]PKC72789.1 orotate phosphoribosyl transferase [Rhizophagus irregularis]PKY24564.1 orotate phosphoribosyl transferase [Rhizophagus irregularis]POG82568.1 orotate phosphoribosyl transferase [Rhizophagus irregularis DAOM 181602=DAOM 197198]|eukprot:XP_025189434.1 orotate phosphoribosyl transferase [Rhizophagus irregularis DAOM 181602=DAOM 197198]